MRFVGFTGHKDPSIHLKMLSFGDAFDAVQLPLNVMDGTFRSFEKQVLGGTAEMIRKDIVTPQEALRYPMTAEEMDVLRKRMAIHAGDGRYELYKTSKHFDGKPGCEQHGFPDDSKLPL